MEEWTKTGTEQQYELNVKCLGILLRVKNSLFSQKFKKNRAKLLFPKKNRLKNEKKPTNKMTSFTYKFIPKYILRYLWILKCLTFYFSSLILPVFNPLPPNTSPPNPPQTPPALPKQHCSPGRFWNPRNSCSCTAASTRSLAKVLLINSQRDLEVVRNAWKPPLKGLEFLS